MKKFLATIVSFVLISISLFSTAALADGTINQSEPYKNLKNSGYVCLTFDDGCNNASYIKKVLDCFKKNNIQCTFFVTGSYLKKHASLWKQAIADGHEICYHSMQHQRLTGMTNAQIKKDLTDWNNLAKQVLGNNYVIPKIVRPPYGSWNPRVLKYLNHLGYYVVRWNMDSMTGVHDKNKNANHKIVAQKVCKYITKAKIGDISLQHFFNDYDVLSVPLYIGYMKTHFQLTKVSIALAAEIKNTK